MPPARSGVFGLSLALGLFLALFLTLLGTPGPGTKWSIWAVLGSWLVLALYLAPLGTPGPRPADPA